MEIIFSDKKQTFVCLSYIGGLESVVFDIKVSSECFEFESKASFLYSDLSDFRENLSAMNMLKCQHVVLSSEDMVFRIEISSDICGHLNCILNIRSVYGMIGSELKLEEDLSFLPERIYQIDEILSNLFDNITDSDSGCHNKVKSTANLSIKLSDIRNNDNRNLNLLIVSSYYRIFRNIEITEVEERDFLNQLKHFYEDKKDVSFYPLGEFANFVLRWKENSIWIDGTVCDNQYPYCSINFNIPCILNEPRRIKTQIRRIRS